MTDELRAKFEVWFAQSDSQPDAYLSSRDPSYVKGLQWEAYQAAHASRDAEVEALICKYEKRSMYGDGGVYSNIIDDLQELLGK